MTNLKCSATNCLHNCDCYCCRGEILVEGTDAKIKDNTCCGSFDLKTEGFAKNNCGHPSESLTVGCEATNCIYNKQRVCHAERIDISGPTAKNPQATECATFKMR